MEQLLSLYNLKTVQFLDNSGIIRNYVFSDKMAAENIFIEHFSIEDEGLEDEEIEDTEEEEIEDSEQTPEYGAQLSVVMQHEGKYYEFLMYHNAIEIGAPVLLVQTIIYLSNLIEKANPYMLVEYLTSISPDPLIPHEITEREFKNVANNLLELKIQTIHSLIQEGKADLN